MDSAMRDLDQLQERGEERPGRRLWLLTLACLLSLAALVAMLSLIGGPGETNEAPAVDPLTELALSARGAENPAAEPPPALAPESLSFPSTLVERGGERGAPRGKPDVEQEDEALLEATVRAAAAEHAVLSGEGAAQLTPKSSAELPAGRIVTSDNLRLSRLAKRDPLVASALPKRATTGLAPPGSEGAFTLQVVSYEAREPAESFASTLRARGHKAFVTQAEVPGRGRFFRVRVGPFTTRSEAEAYQSRFEHDEHMHSLVVASGAE
jgi:DedD protein